MTNGNAGNDITLRIFESKNELCRAAEADTASILDALRHGGYLYYLARYLVALFECYRYVVPIQVWNDYRNALDHFMRHISGGSPLVAGDHIKRMEGHLQRAVLDVAKMLCIEFNTGINKNIKLWGKSVLELVDNGQFLDDIRILQADARALFLKAKIADNNLGQNIIINGDILNLYLDAVFTYYKAIRAFDNKSADLHRMRSRFRTLRIAGGIAALITSFLLGLASSTASAPVIRWLGLGG